MDKINEIRERISQSITAKILTIGVLILILLIPINRIKNLITEREDYRQDVLKEVSEKWGESQKVAGPILTVPMFKNWEDEKKEVHTSWRNLHILPEKLSIKSEVNPDVKHRGMYDVVVYSTKLQIEGTFKEINIEELNHTDFTPHWESAYLTIGVTDIKGIKSQSIKLNTHDFEAIPGVKTNDFVNSGFIINTPLEKKNIDSVISFDINMELNGSNDLQFYPVGKETKVCMTSNWNDPSFNGYYIPANHNISEDGFTANWAINNFNRNYPQYWFDESHHIEYSNFGVELMLPVDHYQKSMRSVKYALMFIFLTFIVFLFFEIINKKRIHPIQYLLVSAGLIIFYTLLLSLSEHIGFNYAYLISSVAIIGLIGFYTAQIFKSKQASLLFFGILVSLYIFLFVILQLKELALMIGSIGLFVILGLVMYYSRKVNWYTPLKKPGLEE